MVLITATKNLRREKVENVNGVAAWSRFFSTTLGLGLILLMGLGCAADKAKKNSPSGNPAATVARGAKTMAIKTVRAGAVISKLIASNTYRGSKKAVTWTGQQTANGTTATLQRLGLKDRPVPLVVLERLPDHLLESLNSLEFVSPKLATSKIVLSSPDSRWEGEIFHRLDPEQSIEIEVSGSQELIVVTLACFSPPERMQINSENTNYTVFVDEDGYILGEVSFAAAVSGILYLYGHQDWRVGWPGVFVVQALEETHSYRFSYIREDNENDPLMICFFLPRYE
jgi:hypothetical protein